MKIRLRAVDFFSTECRTRIPFRFGIATMTAAPSLLARVVAEVDGSTSEGFAADLLVPKWFDKNPAMSLEDDVAALKASARAAAEEFRLAPAAPLFELWCTVYDRRVGLRAEDSADLLTRGFGVALVERALIDAACRAAGVSFFQALKTDFFEFRPDAVHRELAGWSLAHSLPVSPPASIRVRHTVGLSDPILVRDITASGQVRDGVPHALEEVIPFYGVDTFKVKLCGDPARDVPRIEALGALFAERVRGSLTITVDGNEQFDDLSVLLAELTAARRSTAGRHFLSGLRYIEQPLRRSASFDRAKNALLAELTAVAPVIIDEADYGIGAFEKAVDAGYRGISVKNCKGVFRALINRGLCERLQARCGAPLFQSPEDLTNLPVVALQQDLATVAALGFAHVERNGHHYFRGLDHLPRAEQESALANHPDLYERRDRSTFLRIERGALDLRSIQCAGYGYRVALDVASRVPA